LGGKVGAAAFEFEFATAGTRSIPADVGDAGRLGGLGDLAQGEVGVDFVELYLFHRHFAVSGALSFHQFDDFHGGLEAGGGGGIFVTEEVSKSVDCQVGEVGELVEETIGLLLPGGEEGAGEVGVLAGPEVNSGPVDASLSGGKGDGISCDEGLEHLLLSGSQGVEKC